MLIYVILFLMLVAVAIALYSIRQFPGCTGDCRQGRDVCNCKGESIGKLETNQELINPPKDSTQGG